MKLSKGLKWDLAVLGLLAVIVVTMFGGFIFSDKMFFGTDMIPMGYMMRKVVADYWKAEGSIPLWDPYILGGLPVVDAMHGDVFYPASLLYLMMPLHKALGYKIVLHVWLAGVAMYFLLRTLGLKRWSSLVGGLGYMTAPYFLSLIYAGHDAKMFVTALFPLGLMLLEMLIRDPRLLYSALFGATIGLLLLTSHPQMAYFASWGLGLYLIFGLVRLARSRALLKGVAFVVLALAVGIGIGCVQFLPTYDYTTNFSPRTGGVTFEYASSWSLHPEEIVSLLFPSFGGYLDDYWGRNPFKLNAESPGPLVLLLAIGGFIMFLRDRRMWPWLILFIFCPLYALGAHTPIFKVVFHAVPVAKFLRAPSLIMFVFSCSASVLAAFFFEACLAKKLTPDCKSYITGLLALAVALTVLFTIGRGMLYDMWGGLFKGLESGKLEAARQTAGGLNLDAGMLFVFGAGWLLLVLYGFRFKLSKAVLLGAVLAGILATSLPHSMSFVQYLRVSDFLRRDPMIEHVRQDRDIYRVLPLTGTVYDRNYLPMFGLETANGFYDNRIRFYDDLVGEGFRNLMSPNIMDVTNVKYVLTTQRMDFPGLALDRDLGQAFVYRNTGALPRAYLVHRATVEQSDSAAITFMKTSGFDPAGQAILASGMPMEGGPPARSEAVTIDEYSPGRVRLRARLESPGYLCYSGNWLPSWAGYVDGVRTEVLRCNVAMRAIRLDAGEHIVEMRYESRWLRVGTYLCLASCAFVVFSLVYCSKGWPFVRRRERDA